MDLIQQLENEEVARLAKKIPDFKTGDTVVVNVNVVEGERKRVQAFEGVERTFQSYSPLIASVEVKRRGAVRRAKLYYMRQRSGKAARIREKISEKISVKPSGNAATEVASPEAGAV